MAMTMMRSGACWAVEADTSVLSISRERRQDPFVPHRRWMMGIFLLATVELAQRHNWAAHLSVRNTNEIEAKVQGLDGVGQRAYGNHVYSGGGYLCYVLQDNVS